MRVLVTGGRDYQDREAVFRALTTLANQHYDLTGDDDVIVIHGACCRKGRPLDFCGADRWGHEWALEREYPSICVPARWKAYDIAAGPIRNAHMIAQFCPTNVVAFPGGSGTADMVTKARKAGIIVWEPMKPFVRRRL